MSEIRTLSERIAIALSTPSTSDLQRSRGKSHGVSNDEIIAALGACRDGPDDFGPELIEDSALGDMYSDHELVKRTNLIRERWHLAFASECYPAQQATRNVTADRLTVIYAAISYSHAHHCRGREAGGAWTVEEMAKKGKVRSETFVEFVVVADHVRSMIEGEAKARMKIALYEHQKVKP